MRAETTLARGVINRVKAGLGNPGNRWFLRLGILSVVLLTFGVLAAWVISTASSSSPEEVVKRYVRAAWARDFAAAYSLLSESDRKLKSQAQYVRENDPFSGVQLDLARHIASLIEFRDVRTEVQVDRATVTAHLRVPDGNAPVVGDVLFARELQGTSLPEAQQSLFARLDDLQKRAAIPMIEDDETFSLTRSRNGWGVSVGWSNSVRVRFSAKVKNGLPWEFAPEQAEVLAQPGQTVKAYYRVKNLSDKPITGKAVHSVIPTEYAQYMETIQCFCFIQETLNPGEEKELPLIFRVRWDAPPEVTWFEHDYAFYPIESFPGQ